MWREGGGHNWIFLYLLFSCFRGGGGDWRHFSVHVDNFRAMNII